MSLVVCLGQAQVICKYGSLKMREEAWSGKKFTPKDCVKLLETFVPDLEVSVDLVARYFFAWSEILQQPSLFRIICAAQEFWKMSTPFDSVYKLIFLHRKCKGNCFKMQFCMEAICDGIVNGIIHKEDFNVYSKTKNNRGLVDRQLLLWQYLQDLTTGPLIGSCKFSPKEIHHIQWALSLPNYRRFSNDAVFDVGEILGTGSVEPTSSCHGPSSSSARANIYIKFVGDVVYNNKFDNAVSIALRWNFDTETFIKHKAVEWAWDLATESKDCSEPGELPPILPDSVETGPGLRVQDSIEPLELASSVLREFFNAQQVSLGDLQKLDLETIEEAEQEARDVVKQHCCFVDGDQTLLPLAQALRSSPLNRWAGENEQLVVMYDVKAIQLALNELGSF